MASIVSLKRSDNQPAPRRSGQSVTAQEEWCLELTERVHPITADVMLYSLGIPNVYGFPCFNNLPHPENGALLSTGYNTTRDRRAGYIFKVMVSYTTSIGTRTRSEDPTDADPLYRSENVDVEVELEIDPITNRMITNSTGSEPILPRLVGKETLKRFIIVRNERRYNDIRSQETVNHLNSDPVAVNGRTYDPRTLLLEYWNGDPTFDSEGELYFVTTYRFLVDVKNLHKTKLIDLGTGPDKAGNLPPVGIVGGRATRPNKLDGNGLYMSKADQEDPSKFVELEFHTNAEKAMSFFRFRGIAGLSDRPSPGLVLTPGPEFNA
jgi:hypothetical protein